MHMNRITVDETLRARFEEPGSWLELCDESGRTFGFFVPAMEKKSLLYGWARGAFSDEEIERARREPGGLSLDEVLAGIRDG